MSTLPEPRPPHPCPPVELLSGLVDGDLDLEEARMVREHLDGCPACRETLVELRGIRAGLASLRDTPPPEELFGRVASAAARQRRRRGLRGKVGAACGVCLGAVALTLLMSPGAGIPAAPSLDPGGGTRTCIRASAEAELRKAELHYQNAIQMLQTLVNQERPQWSRRRQMAFGADVQVLEQAIRMRRALADSAPADPAVQELLFASYRAQIHYLRDVLSPGSDDAI